MEEYGPPLPPGFQISDDESESEDELQLPKQKDKIIGPQIPSFLSQKSDNDVNLSDNDANLSDDDESERSKMIGPVLPSHLKHNSSDDDEEEVYGPMPPQTNAEYDVVNIIEKRAANMKDKLENKDLSTVKKSEREEWMVVPDTSRKNQLGAISRCLAPGAKVEKKETEYHNPEEDKKITEALKKYNKKKRNESLLDMHSKKRKKEDKKSKNSDVPERKPFDRDEMSVRHFTKDQVNSVIDKAKYLNSRFAPGRKQYL